LNIVLQEILPLW